MLRQANIDNMTLKTCRVKCKGWVRRTPDKNANGDTEVKIPNVMRLLEEHLIC